MMAQYGNMTLREREDKNNKHKNLRSEDESQEIEVLSKDARKSRKTYSLPKRVEYFRGAKFDSQGRLLEDETSPCDCMDKACPGCFMECPRCFSRKCGHECRVNRKWIYEECVIEGTDVKIKASAKKV